VYARRKPRDARQIRSNLTKRRELFAGRVLSSSQTIRRVPKRRFSTTSRGTEGAEMPTLATRATARTQSPRRRTFEASTPTVARGANRPDRDVSTVGIDPTRLARALGWFSLSLGIAEVLAPRFVARLAGVRHVHPGLVRLCGMREIASGMMIFGQGKKPRAAMWSRVAGDAMDIGTLAAVASAGAPGARKGALAFATANVLAVTALDVYCAQAFGDDRTESAPGRSTRMACSVVVNRSPEELYQFWHDFTNFPRFMLHLESVQRTGDRTSHWIARGPAGTRVEWDSEMTVDTPNELIAWRSQEGADVDNSGIVAFEPRPGGRGTIVRVEIEYTPPGGAAGSLVARLFNASPEQQVYDDLHRMKQVLETGEVTRSDAVPKGLGPVRQHAAQGESR
jgi:uncharacterized membrane protein